MAAEARIEVIEGVRTAIVATDFGLPPKLEQLLAAMAGFRFTFTADIRPTGARASCDVDREHRFVRFREGRWFAQSGVRRGQVLDLAIVMCADCGAACVRDRSYDIPTGELAEVLSRRGPNRRDQILGWYTGARPRQRTYM